jgi:hypothetical protein
VHGGSASAGVAVLREAGASSRQASFGGLSLGLASLVRWAPPSQTYLERKVRPRGPSLCAAHRHRGRSLSCFSDLNAREREHTPLGQNVGHIGQYGVKMSFYGAETLKIVILVENHPQKRIFGWLIITPSEDRGVN